VELRKVAQKAMVAEARRHRAYRLVRTCPGLGPVRAAELVAVVVTPYRFRNKRKFWNYCGLGVVERTSSDWVRTRSGEWVRAQVQQTRGLNRDFNHTLKRIFKGAATTVIRQAEDEPRSTAITCACWTEARSRTWRS
jgi:transposase